MTYKQYLDTCDNEFEKAVIIINLARQYPNYDSYSSKQKKELLSSLFNKEMPRSEPYKESESE